MMGLSDDQKSFKISLGV